ncbi:3-hydroxyacyl-CoA dehydrogenase NAD-binding domain-containing protein [Pararoseomonas sp. SCSIO 73927]|uniref:3-hydroxyacyl-CoA dehydrogenase NAD-binding domain-containing protein n=1 Tax=Pararoseomonas sp. SCSIO 73927 TaxID=3114537 RepID=UPI0030CE2764
MTLSEPVSFELRGRTAVLTIDNPPVNGFGHEVRLGLEAGLGRALADEGVDAVVIRGAGRMFCGGADIRQFNTPAAVAQPLLRRVIETIQASSKPVIAAIHGSALGGGLELAMGCHYRVGTPAARLALPEVRLGLLPGGGGTQRLPRLIGLKAAIAMITTGDQVDGSRALELGLLDRLGDDALEEALALAAQVALTAEHPIAGRLPAPADDGGLIAAERARMTRQRHPSKAALACLDCLEKATALPLEDGLTYERARFEELVASPESKAIRHLFFAEREALKVPGVTGVVKPRPIERVAIVGAGTMGGGIAMAFANAGIPVTLVEREQAPLERGLSTISRNYRITAAKGKLTAEQVAQREALITGSTVLGDVSSADLVIEAVFEDMAVKKDLFRELDRLCKDGAVLATNTSRLDVNEIAAATSRPESVIGLHFFSPANVMRLLEVVQPSRVSPEVIATAMAMGQRIGKIPVLVGVCEGFVGNRMLTAYWREAGFLLEEGASPAQIDAAMQGFGMAMGPLAMADLAGMDINWATRKRLAPTRPKHLRYSRVADRICELGRFGQKTGAGYYRYEAGSRTPLPDPVVDDIIKECAREAGIVRRPMRDTEIVDRCVLALVNEGAYILEDGIAQRASDIDLVYVNGYGFPAFRGGPMFHADTLGLPAVLDRIDGWCRTEGEHWKPSALLRRLGEANGRFNA